MPRQIALLIFVSFVAWLLARDLRRRDAVSPAAWLVLAWIVIYAARPVSSWLGTTSHMSPDAYLEGNPLERSVSLVLMALGVLVLIRRGVSVPDLVRRNRWLFVFFGYCVLSVLWSDYPFVALKRVIKDFGNVIIVMVLLTEKAPIEAIKATFVRCAFLLVPLSVLFIRYMPELGRLWGGYNGNDLMYVGVATHKNTLGALLMVSSAFLMWDMASRRGNTLKPRLKFGTVDQALVLAMAVWLLIIANSATSLFCTFLLTAIFVFTGTSIFKGRLRFIELYALGGGALWFGLDAVFNLTELIVLSLGRDMTFTTRTGAWELVIAMQDNPMFGAGFKSFWSGERMVRLWRDLPGIVQAHSGYVELYLNGGLVGLAFLVILLLNGFSRIKRRLMAGDDYARVQLTFWVITLVYNFSEASFNQLSLLWIVSLLILAEPPGAASAGAAEVAAAAVPVLSLQPAGPAAPLHGHPFGAHAARTALRWDQWRRPVRAASLSDSQHTHGGRP